MSLENLHNRIDLVNIPFTERGSRLLIFRTENQLFIRLAERWSKWESEVGHYRQRHPLVGAFTFLNAEGESLALNDIDTYPYVARCMTDAGTFAWTFIDPETLLVKLPAGAAGFEFIVYAEQAQTDYRGGRLRGKRSLAYTTNARITSNTIERLDEHNYRVRVIWQAQEGNALLLNITPRLAFNRSIPDPDDSIEMSRRQWEEWFAAVPPVREEYRPQYDFAWWIMRTGLLNTRYYFTREAMIPSKIHYVGVWHWDQVFHALAYRHVDIRIAEDQLRIVLDHQLEDGMLPDAIHDEGLVTHLTKPVDADVTKPPIMTWAVMKLFETSKRYDFLAEVYEPLTRWHRWWRDFNRNENGLFEYHHPFSSGLDDSPLWDHGMPVIAPDLNTYLVLQQENLAKVAYLIGEHEAATYYRQETETLVALMLKHLWDGQCFRAYTNGQPVPVYTPFSMLPLLTGKFSDEVNEKLIEQLFDPAHFWTEYPIPTVAISDPAFDPNQMWRGPVWININYFFVEALKQCGRHDLAAQLRRKTLDLMMSHSDIYEYYNPLTGEHPPKAAPMFGWSASLFIELALDENV